MILSAELTKIDTTSYFLMIPLLMFINDLFRLRPSVEALFSAPRTEGLVFSIHIKTTFYRHFQHSLQRPFLFQSLPRPSLPLPLPLTVQKHLQAAQFAVAD